MTWTGLQALDAAITANERRTGKKAQGAAAKQLAGMRVQGWSMTVRLGGGYGES